MILTLRNKTCSMKNLACCMIKINQPTRFESNVAVRFPDYKMIYTFPLVRVASIINRLKLYQTIATGVGIPTTAILSALDIVATDTAIIFAACGITWCATFYAIGFLGQNRVGFIYLKDDQKSVKISYTDFWGRRVDTEIDIDDIWPLTDLPTGPFNYFYYSLRRYSTRETLKFNISYGNIIDPDKLRLVLGDPFAIVKR